MFVPRVIFVGGKGGVGKSTLSSALALLWGKQKRTLLISTDPAHNLRDIFSVPESSSPVLVESQLYLLEIEPKKEVEHYISQVAKMTKGFISASSYAMLDLYYDNVKKSGNAQESALFDRLIHIIMQEDWEQIVVDTAPTGHTLRFFALPRVLREWHKMLLNEQERNDHVEGIIGSIEGKNPLKDRLEKRYILYNGFLNKLHNPKEVGIAFVLNPEHLSIQETKRAIVSLQKDSLCPYGLFVNKIPPPSHDDFFQARFQISEQYLKVIREDFSDFPVWEIPLYSTEITHMQGLQMIVKLLLESFHRG